jgi:hypothetical protein
MHIVSLNHDENTKYAFLGSVVAILFKESAPGAPPSFADNFFQKLINSPEILDF